MSNPLMSKFDDILKHTRYKVVVPDTYEPMLPKYFTDNNTKPFYQADSGDTAISMYSISDIVNAIAEGVAITICDGSKVLFIVDILNRYLEEAHAFRENEEIAYQLAKINKALISMKKEVEVYKAHHPEIYDFGKTVSISEMLDTYSN